MTLRVPTHGCPAIGCTKRVPNHLLLCLQHWRRVPRPLQAAIYAAHRRLAAASEEEYARDPGRQLNVLSAVKAIADKEGVAIPDWLTSRLSKLEGARA